jgi:hypothetical protein
MQCKKSDSGKAGLDISEWWGLKCKGGATQAESPGTNQLFESRKG